MLNEIKSQSNILDILRSTCSINKGFVVGLVD